MDLINSFLFSSLQTNLITIHFQNQNTFKFIFNTWYNNKFDWIMSCVKYAIYPLKCFARYEDTKWVIRSSESKDRQYKKKKQTNSTKMQKNGG